jgi:1-acyl-sn-glycerol-3-phosphate acyltransferase
MTETKYGGDRHSAPPTRPALALYAFVRGALELFGRLFWRLSVKGKEHVPPTGAFILAPIHRSNIDTVVVCACTRRRMRYMGKDTMWKYRFSAWFFSSMGGIPVRRDVADREAMRLTLEIAGGTEPIVMFPEGTRRTGPVLNLEDMHDGPAYVACKAGIPIVPVGIGGSEDAMPKGAKGIRPVKLAIDIGRPIYPPESTSGRVSRRAVRELTEEVREAIQELFDISQARVGKPNELPAAEPAPEDP